MSKDNASGTKAVGVDGVDAILEAVLLLGYKIGEGTQAQMTSSLPMPHPAAKSREDIIKAFYVDIPSSDCTVDTEGEIGIGGFSTIHGITVNGSAKILPVAGPEADTGFVMKKMRCGCLTERVKDGIRWEVAVSRMFSGCAALHRATGGVIDGKGSGIVMPKAAETLGDFANRFGERVQADRTTEEDFAAYFGFVSWAFAQVAVALETMHAAGIVHCDVKPQNIFLTPPPPGSKSTLPRVSLGDFGCAQWVPDVAMQMPVPCVMGTEMYIPPESYCVPKHELNQLREASNNPSITFHPSISAKTDVFAFGASLCEVLNFGVNGLRQSFASRQAFLQQVVAAQDAEGTNEEEMAKAAFTFRLISCCPEELVEVAELCLVIDHHKRVTMAEARTGLTAVLLRVQSAATLAKAWKLTPFACEVRAFAQKPAEPRETTVIANEELVQILTEQETQRFALYDEMCAFNDKAVAAAAGKARDAGEDVDIEDDANNGWELANRIRDKQLVPNWHVARLLRNSVPLEKMYCGDLVYEGPRGGHFVLKNGTDVRYIPKAKKEATCEGQSKACKLVAAGHSDSADTRKGAEDGPTCVKPEQSCAASVDKFGGRSTGKFYVSSGSANGNEIFEGINCGLYYHSANGNRTYLK